MCERERCEGEAEDCCVEHILVLMLSLFARCQAPRVNLVLEEQSLTANLPGRSIIHPTAYSLGYDIQTRNTQSSSWEF